MATLESGEYFTVKHPSPAFRSYSILAVQFISIPVYLFDPVVILTRNQKHDTTVCLVGPMVFILFPSNSYMVYDQKLLT